MKSNKNTKRRLHRRTISDLGGTDAARELLVVDPLLPDFVHGEPGDYHPHGQ